MCGFKPAFIPLECDSFLLFHLALKHGHTNLPSTALIFEFIHYPYPSASITHPVTAPHSQPHTQHRYTHTHTHKQQNLDTLHRQRIDYQCGFYWRVWGADTSELGLLILLSYPNEPCVIHHCSAGSTQAAWMAGRTELRRDRDYHLATRYISMRVSWIPYLKGINSNKKRGSCLSYVMWGFGIG